MNRNLAVVFALLSIVFVPSVGAADSVWMKAANQHELDPVVLYALALQESRRLRPDGKVRPWPWTLHAKGHGAMYFDSYDEALVKLVELIDDGVSNVDIGMMQINWGANGHLLPDPAKLLQPQHNIDIGATILRLNLNQHQGDLRQAIAHYHSPSEARGNQYAQSVLTILQNLRQLRGFSAALAF